MVATVYPHLWKPSPELPERGLTRGGGFYESGVVITDDEVDADGRVTVDVEFGEAERFVGLVRLWIARRGDAIAWRPHSAAMLHTEGRDVYHQRGYHRAPVDGMRERQGEAPYIGLTPTDSRCPRCHGAGWVSYGTSASPDATWGARCPRCDGTGRIAAR